MPKERDGERSVAWTDLLKLGDPRDPDWLRQHWLLRCYPDRVAIVMGEPALVSALRERWLAARDTSDESSFTEYVSLRGALSLERAERQLRGSRYKVPMFVRQDILTRRSVVTSLAQFADEKGSSLTEIVVEASDYLREIAAKHSPYLIDLVAHATRALIRKAYGEELHYDRAELRRLYELGQKHTLVFLPSHKSHLDRLVLQLALYENGLPPNHTAGGINLNFFPVGPLVRGTGVFFIRRSFKDNPLYKYMLRRYVRYLVDKRFPLEWYIEGGRSRLGKLRPPRYGMLSYVVDAYQQGSAEDVVLIPVSIAYDQIQDVSAYAKEQAGGVKKGENVAVLINFVRTLRKHHGGIYLRFGEPLSLTDDSDIDAVADPDHVTVDVQKLAFDVLVRINEVTPITPISLVTLALLGSRDRALTVEDTLAALEPYLNYAKQRQLPTTEEFRLDTPERVKDSLDALTDHGIVARYHDGVEPLYSIAPERHLAAAYYRNTVIHLFVAKAITELALLHSYQQSGDAAEAFWDEAMRLRDLLKFEFFFKRKEAFRQQLESELDMQDALWRRHFEAGDAGAVLSSTGPFTSVWVLRPFLEAYRVVAERLAELDAAEVLDTKAFLSETLTVAKQQRRQQQIRNAESVSNELFKSALDLAVNRGLTKPGEDIGELREGFLAEIVGVLDLIDSMAGTPTLD